MTNPTPTQFIGGATSDYQRLRLKWAANLAQYLEARHMTRKEFRHALGEAGVQISRQAVDQWLAGNTAPRPHHQVIVARILSAPVGVVFPLDFDTNS